MTKYNQTFRPRRRKMINVLVTINRRARGPVRTGLGSHKDIDLVVFESIQTTIQTFIKESPELKERESSPRAMVTVIDAHMGDCAFAQIDVQLFFKPPDGVLEPLGTAIGNAVEGIAKEHFERSSIPTNIVLFAWWASIENAFLFGR